MKEHIVRALCCMKVVARKRLETAVQEDCTSVGGDHPLWKDVLDWCVFVGQHKIQDNTRPTEFNEHRDKPYCSIKPT